MDSADASPGAGWWQAADSKWYPPDIRPVGEESLPTPLAGFVPGSSTGGGIPQAGAEGGSRRLSRSRAKYLLVIGVCAAYVFSPVDVAPELVLGPLGLPDDIVAAVAAIGVYVARVRKRR